jgi:hypothetical protein
MLQSKTSKKPKLARAKGGAKKPIKAKKTHSHPASSGTKQEAVLALLRRPVGATIGAIMKATGWQQHSVRGFLAGVVRNKLKLKLDSNKVDGVRTYHVAGEAPSKASGQQPKRRTA